MEGHSVEGGGHYLRVRLSQVLIGTRVSCTCAQNNEPVDIFVTDNKRLTNRAYGRGYPYIARRIHLSRCRAKS